MSLEELIKYIKKEILTDTHFDHLSIDFGEDNILIFVFENDIPIRISKTKVYYEEDPSLYDIVTYVELYTELFRYSSISKVELEKILQIIDILEKNIEIFEIFLK